MADLFLGRPRSRRYPKFNIRRDIPEVREITKIRVWGRDQSRAEKFAEVHGTAVKAEVEVVASVEQAVKGADIICTVTAAKEPILFGRSIEEGMHINLVGSSFPDKAEVDTELVVRSRYFVDYRESTLAQACEFLRAKEEGAVDDGHIVAEIGEVLMDEARGRESDEEITVYKSLGVIAQDLSAATYVWRQAESRPWYRWRDLTLDAHGTQRYFVSPTQHGMKAMPRAFEPQFMKIGVLTAALQELTPRDVRDADPDRAIEDWIVFARQMNADNIQLSAALHPSEADVPPEAMLDPVANTLDLRQPFDAKRAQRVKAVQKEHRIGLSDVAFFDNMLHHDPEIRRKKHDFMLRVYDAAVLLDTDAVCGFVGRNAERSMEENLQDFEESFIPLLKAAKERGLSYRVEQCPMPGWTTGDSFHNNIAYAPGPWIALHRICEKHGVGEQFRIHYDPSHSILMGQDTRSMFQYLKDEGYGFLIGGFHVKGQVIDSRGVSAWGYGGQTLERGDWKDGKPSEVPADLLNAWKKQTVLCEHELPGTARHDPLAYLQNRTVDWLDHQLAARELLDLDVANTHLVVEHEYPPARIQDKDKLKPILEGSIAFTRKIDEAAACMFALQSEVLSDQGIPVQGTGREAYRS